MPISVHLVWARVYFLAILVKEMSNFGNSCKETQIFFEILVHRMQKLGKFCLENANSWHFDVEISLAKGIIFRKIGLANGAILKQWAAHPCPKFSREPPPPRALTSLDIYENASFYPYKNICVHTRNGFGNIPVHAKRCDIRNTKTERENAFTKSLSTSSDME